jgi:hypothetical protein
VSRGIVAATMAARRSSGGNAGARVGRSLVGVSTPNTLGHE